MSNRTYLIFIISVSMFTLISMSGCGKYFEQYSSPLILSRYPALGATNVPTNEIIWVKFSKRMDTFGTTIEALLAKVLFAADNSAQSGLDPSATPEAKWSENNTKLTITNVFFVSTEAAARVHILATKEGFEDLSGLYIQEHTTLWNYLLE